MRKRSLLGSTAAGLVAGALLFNSPPAKAFLGLGDIVSDPGLYEVMGTVQGAVVVAIQKMQEWVADRIVLGFNQTANVLRGQTAAGIQIADASNTAMAGFHRDTRNAEIAASHAVSPAACLALDGAQMAAVGGQQARAIALILDGVSDERGEGAAGTPNRYGQGQAARANRDLHYSRYCSQIDVQSGVCAAVSALPNGDQRADSVFGHPTYPDQVRLNAANDYVLTLLQPTPPAPLQGDELKGEAGAQLQQARKNYNARMSMAFGAANLGGVAARAASVQLTDDQRAQQRALGRTPTDTASAHEAMELDVLRRYGGQDWNAALEGMTAAPAVLREIARQLATISYQLLVNTDLRERDVMLHAADTAADAERDLRSARQLNPTLPIPLLGASR